MTFMALSLPPPYQKGGHPAALVPHPTPPSPPLLCQHSNVAQSTLVGCRGQNIGRWHHHRVCNCSTSRETPRNTRHLLISPLIEPSPLPMPLPHPPRPRRWSTKVHNEHLLAPQSQSRDSSVARRWKQRLHFQLWGERIWTDRGGGMQADPEGGSGELARGREGDARQRMTMLGAGARDGDRGAVAHCRGGGAAGCQSH
jgi:hypothetical protein